MSDASIAAVDVVRHVIDALNRGDLDSAETFIDPEAVNQAAPAGSGRGLAAFRPGWQSLRTAFPDWTFTIDESVSDGELVACRYTNTGVQTDDFQGRPATGRAFTASGLDMVRVRAGLVVEHWALLDLAAMGEQLGWSEG